jgi:hypothetical protein
MDNASAKQEKEKASNKTNLNVNESSLQFTAAISRKYEFFWRSLPFVLHR